VDELKSRYSRPGGPMPSSSSSSPAPGSPRRETTVGRGSSSPLHERQRAYDAGFKDGLARGRANAANELKDVLDKLERVQ